MKVVRLNPQTLTTMSQPARQVIALGFFDGVHQGHQRVIARARQLADERHLPLAVMTFNRHVSRVFNTSRQTDFRYLNTLAQKLALLAQNRVDTTYVVDFDRAFAAITPEAFVTNYLIRLNAQVVVGGFDYTFGQGGRATIEDMPRYNHGAFEVAVVAELDASRQKIGSTEIRRLIKYGQIQRANELLGHPYAVAGQLINDGTNRLQLRLASRLQQLPPRGAYQVGLQVGVTRIPGTLNVTATGLFIQVAADAGLGSARCTRVEVAVLNRRAVSVRPVTTAPLTMIQAI
ncbi:FAD synthetase [Lactiplantibacillus garii]|uniref:FAD synthase n=1 Tax=Lactiplantibacillus garii TaxID=2306423 RepID=A0A3R8KJE1_9LACO|nr:FAD synthetase family protein [Lactiplantibacillus garii]RRK09258.1 FAD synthetase [Lactiplantibacillus garii]